MEMPRGTADRKDRIHILSQICDSVLPYVCQQQAEYHNIWAVVAEKVPGFVLLLAAGNVWYEVADFDDRRLAVCDWSRYSYENILLSLATAVGQALDCPIEDATASGGIPPEAVRSRLLAVQEVLNGIVAQELRASALK